MPYGFEMYTQDGNVLNVSSNYFNLSLVQTGLLSELLYMNNIGGGQLVRGMFNTGLKHPTVAVEISEGRYVTIYDVDTNLRMFDIWAAAGVDLTKVKYYVFSAGNTSNKTYGRQVFNDLGECVFDSNLKYMRILGRGAITVDKPTIAAMCQGRSGTFDRIYVGQASGKRQYWDKETFTTYARSGNAVVTQKVTIDYGYVLKSYAMPDGFISRRSLPAPLILNVTNF